MKSVEFCYWLQGLFELSNPLALDAQQTATIKKHLNMVFIHEIDPSYPQKAKLDAAHIPQQPIGPLSIFQPFQPNVDPIVRC